MIPIEHIHPMLVHFPIVLFTTALSIDAFVVFARGGDLSARRCLSLTGLAALVAGLVFAVLAAVFGDIALDIAIDRGFERDPLEEHEGLAGTTIVLFGLLTVVQSLAVWRAIPLSGNKGKAFVAILGIGFLLLASTAYHGGELVYGLGVNVKP